MRCQTAGRNQRSRGFHYVKQAFQLTLLAVLIWFLYQITHSNNKDHLGNVETKFREGHDAIILGRKQNVGQLSGVINTANQGDENVQVVEGKREDRGGGDVVEKKENDKELDKSYSLLTKSVDNFETEVKENDREVSSQENLQERLENPQIDVTNHDVVGDQKDLEKQIDPGEQGDSKDSEGQIKKPHEDREISTHTVVESRDQVKDENKEHDGDKDPGSDKKLAMRPNGTHNNLVLSQSTEMGKGEIGFHDENGVPQDGSDALDFAITESRDGGANKVQHQEVKNIS